MAWRSQLRGHLQRIPVRAGLPLQGSAEPTRFPRAPGDEGTVPLASIKRHNLLISKYHPGDIRNQTSVTFLLSGT